MTGLIKYDLEKMLKELDLSQLRDLHSKSLWDDYGWGHQPLLNYSPEALCQFADKIYNDVLLPIKATDLTEDVYKDAWLTPQRNFEGWLKNKEQAFYATLNDIIANPEDMPPSLLPDIVLPTFIADLLNNNDSYYSSLASFICHSTALWHSSVTDRRILDLRAEVTIARAKSNKDLEVFIGRQLRAARKAVNAQLEPLMPAKRPRKAKVADDQKKVKSYLASPAYDALCANINLANKLNTYLRANSLRDNTERLKHLFYYAESRTEHNAQALVQQAKEVHTLTAEMSDVFAKYFVSEVGGAYGTLTAEIVFDIDDFVNADCLAFEDNSSQRAEIRLVLAQKGLSEHWFDDYSFKDLESHLTECLTSLFDGQTTSVQSHGAIIGTQAFAQHIYTQVRSGKAYAFDSVQLAQELRKQVQFHTIAVGSIGGIVQFGGIVPLGAEQYAEYAKDRFEALSNSTLAMLHIAKYGITKVCSPVPLPHTELIVSETLLQNTDFKVSTTTNGFSDTQGLQEQLDTFNATAVLTAFEQVESLSVEQIQSVMPVRDHTLQHLIRLFVGQQCKAVLLNDELLAQMTDGQYLRIVPEVDAKGYSFYGFQLINQSVLHRKINDLEYLLSTLTEKLEEKEEDDDDQDLRLELEQGTWKPLSLVEELSQRATDYKKAEEHYEGLLQLANIAFEAKEKYALEAEAVSAIVRQHYYKPLRKFSQHHLVTYVCQPEKYKLVSKEIVSFDEDGLEVDYDVHHIVVTKVDGKPYRSNHPYNLAVRTEKENAAMTSKSKPVTYKDKSYYSLSAYCVATSAGTLRNLQHVTKDLNLGDSKDYNGRVYTKIADGKLTATDIEAPQQGTQVDLNGVSYNSIADFAKATKLSAGGLRKKLYDMRATNTTDFKWKGYRFEVLKNAIKTTKL